MRMDRAAFPKLFPAFGTDISLAADNLLAIKETVCYNLVIIWPKVCHRQRNERM